jgi:hypothetical protein
MSTRSPVCRTPFASPYGTSRAWRPSLKITMSATPRRLNLRASRAPVATRVRRFSAVLSGCVRTAR